MSKGIICSCGCFLAPDKEYDETGVFGCTCGRKWIKRFGTVRQFKKSETRLVLISKLLTLFKN